MEEIFSIIGKLYVDVYNSQRLIEILQQQLKDKDTQSSIQDSQIRDKDE